jgi:hypothetical protein
MGATLVSFLVIFFVWACNYIALELEQPFGRDANSLPMRQMQKDWNKSLSTLTQPLAHSAPTFTFTSSHRLLEVVKSDGSSDFKKKLTLPKAARETLHVEGCVPSVTVNDFRLMAPEIVATKSGAHMYTAKGSAKTVPSRIGAALEDIAVDVNSRQSSPRDDEPLQLLSPDEESRTSRISREDMVSDDDSVAVDEKALTLPLHLAAKQGSPSLHAYNNPKSQGDALDDLLPCEESIDRSVILADHLLAQEGSFAEQAKNLDQPGKDLEEDFTEVELGFALQQEDFEEELRSVGERMKELHARIIDEEIGLLSSLGSQLLNATEMAT